MPTMPNLPELTVGPAARHGSVTVVPVFAATSLPPAEYDLGATALAEGQLEIRELSRGASVDQLQARNRGGKRLLLLDGDHLIGARQNRMLTSSVLIAGRTELELPVSCVERGRWEQQSARVAGHASCGSPRLRRIARMTVTRALLAGRRRAADQSQIWSQIATQQQSLRVSSATSSLAHSFAARATDIGEIAARLPYPAGAIGVAIGVGTELVSVDLFDRPETCRRYWQRLIEGAALDGLGVAPRAGLPGGAVIRLLDELRAASWSAVAAVGDGDELRVQTRSAAASLLILDGRVVHFGAATGAAPGAAVDSRAAVMRHDLPEHLAARYQIVSRIGLGGAKEVFRAVDTHGGPDVAIARIPDVDPDQFDDEIALARRVHSDHVPRVLDALVDAHGDGYLVMERCDGPSLAHLVAGGPLSVADAAPILVAFARGLEAIHRVAVLHRDIKLENVMLSSGTDVPKLKILDFGLSRRAVDETSAVFDLRELAGTAPYMASEIVDGTNVDARTDVYAFGVCCFRLLTGEFPTPLRAGESRHEYLGRVGRAAGDVSRLPAALPDPARAMIGRTLHPDRTQRPYMPEVVAAFEHAFGAPPLAVAPRAPAAPRPFPLERAARVAVSVASPEHVLVAECAEAPFVTLAPDAWGIATHVRAIAANGATRWMRRLDGHLVTGIRADLDGDGVREIYLAGTASVVGMTVSGAVRFTHATAAEGVPSLLGLPDRAAPGLAIDGRVLDVSSGATRGPLAFAYRGDGQRLVAAGDPRGLSYNGLALQGFCGDHGTAAAVIHFPGENRFIVAHLEETRAGRIQVGVYGAGGVRLDHLVVADCQVDTGDLSAISRVYHRRAPLFGPRHAPIAVHGRHRTAVVIVPLLDPDHGVPPTLVGFELPSGRELWRHRPDAAGGRALLADVDGNGRPQLIVGDGRALVAYDPWTGRASAPLPCKGLPVAYGDPLATGFAHLITAGEGGIELWRGPQCRPGAMAWTGARGDLWRTGALRDDGSPLGPV